MELLYENDHILYASTINPFWGWVVAEDEHENIATPELNE